MNPWVRLLRPGNGAISFAGTVVGGWAAVGVLAQGGWSTATTLLLAGLTTFLVTSAGNVLNDYLDREGDKKNHPDRPLPKGEVQPSAVRTYSALLFALSGVPLMALLAVGRLPSSWTGTALTLLIWGGAVLLLVGYELRWKAQGLVGNLSVAVLTGAVFLFGAAVVGAPVLAVPLAGMAILATLSREIIKDMEDAEGDVDRSTLPRVHGLRVAGSSARAAVLAAVLLSPVPLLTWLPVVGRSPFPGVAVRWLISLGPGGWSLSLAGIIYLAFVAAADLVFVLSVKDLPERLHREQSLSKLAMVLALVAFLGAGLR